MIRTFIKIYRRCLFLLIAKICTGTIASAQGLQTPNTQRIVAQIDSLSKHSTIEQASVCFKEVDSSHGETSTDTWCAEKSQKFSFHNGFLQIGNSYYNLDKLLYFEIEEERRKKIFIFYFQYY